MIEYYNKNSLRKFPFSDIASLTTDSGITMDNDVVVDAYLCIHSVAGYANGTPYLSLLDPLLKYIEVSDNRGVVCQGTYDSNIAVMTHNRYGNTVQAGVIVLGPGITALTQTLAFKREAAEFACRAFNTVSTGVRGFRLPDGDVVTGSVTFQGVNGVHISTGYDKGKGTLNFSIASIPDDINPNCDNEPICKIRVIRKADSGFAVSKLDDNTLGITTVNFSLDTICDSINLKSVRHNDYDPCEDNDDDNDDNNTEPGAPEIVGDTVEEFDICTTGNGIFSIVTPSGIEYLNPMAVNVSVNSIILRRIVTANIGRTDV